MTTEQQTPRTAEPPAELAGRLVALDDLTGEGKTTLAARGSVKR